MKLYTHTSKRKNQGSTEFDPAFPAWGACPMQASDGGYGRVPRVSYAPPMLKPAVLATRIPDPSHGTLGTAIGAGEQYPGAAPSRLWHRSGRLTRLWQLEQVQAKLVREYLAVPLIVLTCSLLLHFLPRMIRVIQIPRHTIFHTSALPLGVSRRFVHDRVGALFRRRAVFYTLKVRAKQSNFHGKVGREETKKLKCES